MQEAKVDIESNEEASNDTATNKGPALTTKDIPGTTTTDIPAPTTTDILGTTTFGIPRTTTTDGDPDAIVTAINGEESGDASFTNPAVVAGETP